MRFIDKIKAKRIAKKEKRTAEIVDFLKTASDEQFVDFVNIALDRLDNLVLQLDTAVYDTIIDVLIQKMHPITKKDIATAKLIATTTRCDLQIKEKPEWHIEGFNDDAFCECLIGSSFDDIRFTFIAYRLASRYVDVRNRLFKHVCEISKENIFQHTPNNKGHNV